ncbi:MAG: hypothetical protein ACXADO_10880 [Candidatus Thorarchaeota archaeon]
MTARCGACGSRNNVQIVYDSSSNEGELRCQSCVNSRFPLGTRVVKFTDSSRPLRRAYYMSLETEDDLDLLLTVGERARKIRAEGFEAYFYRAHMAEKVISPRSFSLGHADSAIQLRGHIDKLRLWMETSRVFSQINEEEEEPTSIPKPAYPLFAPINY